MKHERLQGVWCEAHRTCAVKHGTRMGAGECGGDKEGLQPFLDRRNGDLSHA